MVAEAAPSTPRPGSGRALPGDGTPRPAWMHFDNGCRPRGPTGSSGGSGRAGNVICRDRNAGPDASVLLRWVLPGHDEQDTDVALALREQTVAGTLDLVVPQLWIYEVGNTLALRFPGDAEELLASLADFDLTEAKLDSRWRTRAASLSVAYGVAFYDAAYHAVALRFGGVFVTADERYVRRASGAGGISSLRLRWML